MYLYVFTNKVQTCFYYSLGVFIGLGRVQRTNKQNPTDQLADQDYKDWTEVLSAGCRYQ